MLDVCSWQSHIKYMMQDNAYKFVDILYVWIPHSQVNQNAKS